jgi:hypothetical protein
LAQIVASLLLPQDAFEDREDDDEMVDCGPLPREALAIPEPEDVEELRGGEKQFVTTFSTADNICFFLLFFYQVRRSRHLV